MEELPVSRRLAIEMLISMAVMSVIGVRYVLAKDSPLPPQIATLRSLPPVAPPPLPTATPTPAPTALIPIAQGRPDRVLGLHLQLGYINNPDRLADFKERLFSTGANCAVIEIKNESGMVAVPFQHDLRPGYLDRWDFTKLAELVAWLTSNQIYPVARQVVMMDNVLANETPRLYLHYPYRRQTDASGHVWLDPRHAEVADYNASIAQTAAQMGFAEIQLDYIRFPEANFDMPFSERVGAIAGAISTIRSALNERTLLTIDVLGDTTREYPEDISDVGVGQHIPTLAQFVDGICPMLYPDLRATGFEIDFYGYVYNSTLTAREKIAQGGASAFVSPWIQAYYPADREKIQQQVHAALDAGANGAFAWEPTSYYPDGMYRLAE